MSTQTTNASWRALLTGANARVSTVLAGGVALYAITVYVAGAVLPALTEDLHGDRLYAWVNSAFLAASIAGSAVASRAAARWGIQRTYLVAFSGFTIGSAIVALAPSMELVVVGRAVQGVGGGLLSALAYVSVSVLLPPELWARATGLITAMWGIGGIAGPAVGGGFGEAHGWRLPFVGLVAAAIGLGILTRFAVDRTAGRSPGSGTPLAWGSLVAVLLAVAAFSCAVLCDGFVRLAWVGAGVVLLVFFGVVDSRSARSLLPSLSYAPRSRLGWLYLLVGVLTGSVMIEAFVPLFGQREVALSPFIAGYLGAVPSIGWTLAQLWSSSVRTSAARRRFRTAGPFVTLAGFVGFAVSAGFTEGPWWIWWIPALLATGVGVGLAFPHLVVAAISAGRDETESAQTGGAVSVVQLLANAVATSIGGVLLATEIPGLAASQVTAVGFAVVVAAGIAVSSLGVRFHQSTGHTRTTSVG